MERNRFSVAGSSSLADSSLLFVRVILAFVVAAHGAQKLLGWFGGYGFDGTIDFFTNTIGLPYFFALLIILTESVGMLVLAIGMGSRILAASVILIMIGAIATLHGQFGFFMNWSGNLGGEGFEYHLLVATLASVIVVNGSGKYSLDAYLQARFPGRNVLASLYS